MHDKKGHVRPPKKCHERAAKERDLSPVPAADFVQYQRENPARVARQLLCKEESTRSPTCGETSGVRESLLSEFFFWGHEKRIRDRPKRIRGGQSEGAQVLGDSSRTDTPLSL